MAPYDDSFIRKHSEGYFSQDASNQSLQLEQETSGDISDTERIFVNQSLDFSSISCYGFDMDYTLCEYISPNFDQLGFNLAQRWLVDNCGYSPEILQIKYDPSFAVRGLWFDRLRGNLLKVDQFGEILQCFHGFRALNSEEIDEIYPETLQNKDKRIFIMNTLFNLPETFLIAALIEYFDNNSEYEVTSEGWRRQNIITSFAQVFQDVRAAVDDIHLRSLELKKSCISRIEEYVRRDPRLGPMLLRIRESGRKTFLLTNSDWWYTNNILSYLLGGDWRSYFDCVIVDACKPKFFSGGREVRLVNPEDGSLTLAPELERIPAGAVLSGGEATTITRLLGVPGREVIYCGDHLHADIIKCRQLTDWKTLLVVPELSTEVSTSRLTAGLLEHLGRLESLLASNPKLTELKCRLDLAVAEFDRSFCRTGSLFRSGDRLSYFGAMLKSWAQLYTGSVCNITEYSLDHRFLVTPERLVHETQHCQNIDKDIFDVEDENTSTNKNI